jgi:uncharacterized membrane protein
MEVNIYGVAAIIVILLGLALNLWCLRVLRSAERIARKSSDRNEALTERVFVASVLIAASLVLLTLFVDIAFPGYGPQAPRGSIALVIVAIQTLIPARWLWKFHRRSGSIDA